MSFTLKALIVAAILVIVEFIVGYYNVASIPWSLYAMTFLFAVLTILIYRSLSKSNKENPQKFVTSFMGALGIKLFASLIFITVYLFVGEDEYKIPMAIGLMIVYSVNNVILLRQLTMEIRKMEESS